MSEYGCHVDLLPGEKPDGCVLDIGRAVDCLVAQSLKASGLGKSECMHWRPIADCASELSRAYALIEEMREALSACQISIVGNLRAMRLSGPALDKADAFLAERVK